MAARSAFGITGPVKSEGPGGVRASAGARYSGRAVR